MRIYGDQVLRQVAREVEEINGRLAELADGILQTMKHNKAVGLAANQIGALNRIFALDASFQSPRLEPFVLINPEIVEVSGLQVGEEGCLSFPGIFEEIERPQRVTVKGLNLEGEELQFEGEGIVARAILHELDHLNGRLIIDHVGSIKKQLISARMRKISKGNPP
ncbi:MAG: peptide deformylase [Candidatus Zixiibacteriota bacterium]